jgi:quinol monooxygenase YgiN
MIIIVGSLSFDPSDRADVLASLAEVTEASRRDAGCMDYTWAEDLSAPNTFRFFECWESQELLDAHLAAPHEAAFGERNLHRITGATASIFEAAPAAPAAPAALVVAARPAPAAQ